MPSTDTKPELTAKASVAQPVSQPAVYANGLKNAFRIVAIKQTFMCNTFSFKANSLLLKHKASYENIT
jgi:hypothetical protein